MAEIKISDLTPKGANLTITDLLVVSEDIGGGLYETKSITGDEVLNAVAKTTVAVRNQTGVTIYKGTIVYISGASGGKALISKAQANSEATSSKTLGVVTADIANNANGNVLTNGLLTLLDTRTTATHPFTADTLAIGDDLYLSPTTAGYVTNVKPIAPNNLVNIGKVLETSATTGQILYAIVNGYELGELHDVDTTGAVSGNVLALNGGIWKPTTSGITIGTTPITSGVAGRVLFEGAGNVVQEDSGLFWDNTNKRLGIGASTPASTLNIGGSGTLASGLTFGSGVSGIWLLDNTTIGIKINNVDKFWFRATDFYPDSSLSLDLGLSSRRWKGLYTQQITDNGSNVLINTITDQGGKLQVKAGGALSTDIALRIRNSADTSNLFMVKGNGVLNAANLPTSATGLVAGDIWNNGGILTIV